MQKILPVNLDTKITTEIYNYIRLAAIMTEEGFLPWFIERFIALHVDENYFFSNYYIYGSLAAKSVYDEVLLTVPLSFNDNITGEIKKHIDNNGYIQILCDKYYIEGSLYYNKFHFFHELMLVGYKENPSVFFFTDLNTNKQLTGIHSVSEKSLLISWNEMLKFLKNKKAEDLYNLSFMQFDFPASAFYLRRENMRWLPSLNHIYYALQYCMNMHVYQTNFCGLTSVNRVGSGIYKIYYENLYQRLHEKEYKNILLEHDSIILISLKRLIENKAGIYFRFNYLMTKKMITEDITLLEKMQQVKEHLEYAFNCLTKYAYTFESEFLEEAVTILKKTQQIDTENLDRCLQLVGSAIQQGYFLYEK